MNSTPAVSSAARMMAMVEARAVALDHPDDFNDPEKIAAGQINFVLAAVVFEALAPGLMQSA